MQVIVTALIGFVAGVIANLIADYVPARRLHREASANPFTSRSSIPPLRPFIPCRTDGRPWPVYLWSGTIATLTGTPVFVQPRRLRRIAVEIGLAAAFAWIMANFPDASSLPFLLFYAVIFALVVVIDVEYRWILWEIILVACVGALAESILVGRVPFTDALRGGLYGFGVLFALYVLGFAFARVVGVLRGRRISRTVLGFGDVRLATFSGLVLGWRGLGPALLLMVVTGAIAALLFIVIKLLRTRRYRAFGAIPYGPYIVIGTAVSLYLPSFSGLLICLFLVGCM